MTDHPRSDCANCKAYQRSLTEDRPLLCYEADWYAPSWIRYCRPQVFWYLVNCETIRVHGKWPTEGTAADPSIRSKTTRVPSKSAEQLASEIDARLKRTGWRPNKITHGDGQSLIDEIEAGATSYSELRTYAARMALNYISGYRRRLLSYPDWLYKQQEQQKNKVAKTTF